MNPGGTARRVFTEEARDLLIDLEEALLELESHPGDVALMARVFRALHTLKGTGAMFGFDAVARFTHAVEDLFDSVRKAGVPATSELLALGLDAKDHLQELLERGASDPVAGKTPSADRAEDAADADGVAARERALLERIGGLAARWAAPAVAPGTFAASSGGRDDDAAGAAETSPSALAQDFSTALPEVGLSPDESTPSEPSAVSGGYFREPRVYWLRYTPSPDALRRGLDPSRLLDGLRGLGPLHVWPHCETVPGLDGLDAEAVHLRWDAVLVTEHPVDMVREPFVALLDEAGLEVAALGEERLLPSPELLCRIAAQGRVADAVGLLEAADAGDEALRAVRGQGTRGEGGDASAASGGQPGAASSRTSSRTVPSAPAVVPASWPVPECAPPAGDDAAPAGTLRPGGDEGATTSLRVDSAKVDRLLDNVGELVILQARLSRIATDHDDPRLRELAEGLERLTESLRDSTMSVRMVPLDATFHAFRRLVRDLAARLGKDVRFVAEGGETELDKTVIDHLRDPLLHLVRNAMDHGVEPAAVRLAAGKPAEAVLRLSAAHAGGEVLITVSDDGAGIDLDKLRAVGVARGLLAPDADPGEAELLQLLFLPGFSTASGVSDLSGRGVGLDVVSTALGSLRGSVDVVTRRGEGTAWRLRIPLTLAIIDGLRVRVGDEAFILPLTQVQACLERFVDGEAATLGLIEYRDRLVPCLSLRRFLEVPGEQPAYERVIIANVDGQPVGFAVDGVAGLEQAVIKRLGGPCRRAAWIAGSSVDAEGGISLILDAAQLVRVAQGMQER
ncbi:chemotaxis protein CheA [Nitratidesulfovibrio sp. SRB-5]|uniref:chemotaxis protein CheA n=1 Tax=Nitratidesulfovibrio sp. SRB-5 TaxID=2872636 RepID=UPI001024E3FC|nr:chemotaxis protein CheA [Nitratidesulfovibrio sp. SRB-5]MBZ2173058.1 chemotaxis protein CheA [Nitratidesulfovibrio sp. SRB-5]RXF75268.1 chemotaxis protein CheA [Desulfovibrio sp. DS-1]